MMNILLSPVRRPLALGLLFLPLLATPVIAEEIFTEEFDGAAGEVIDGRTSGKAVWIASSANVVLDGAGHAVLDGEGKQSGWISRALPELREGDVITIHARLKPRSPWRGWIGIGFTSNPGSMFQENGALAIVLRAPYGNETTGNINLFSGPGTTDDRILSSFDDSPFQRTPDLEELEATYDTGSGEWTCSLNGVEVFRGKVAFDGIEGEPVPMEFLSHLCIQWADQIAATATNPGLVDEIRLERQAGGAR